MPSHTHKHPLSGVARWHSGPALCSAGMIGAWLAPGASAMASTPAASTPAANPAVVIHSPVKTPSAKAVLAYWTPAWLRAAKPASVIVARTKPKAVPVTSASSRASPARSRAAGQSGHAAVAPPTKTITPEAFPYPYPYDSFTPAWALWRTYPYEVNGKLFFTNGGSGFVCSATAVASASGTKNENEIWTAGHCLVNTESNNQVYDSSAIFIPAYNGNLSNFDPFGDFTWDGGSATTTAWLNNLDLTEDEAAMAVRKSSTTGRTLGQAVGWDGFAWNEPGQRAVRRLRVPGSVPVQR